MPTAIKESGKGGDGGKQPNKNDGAPDPNRPPPFPKAPETKAQYALYLDGRYVRIQQLDSNGMNWTSDTFADQGIALAWFEEKTPNVHFFLFKLGMICQI